MSARRAVLFTALLLLAAFLVSTFHLTRESLWYDEGWTAWAVHDDRSNPASVGETLQHIRDSLTGALSRVRDDVHPPLYFLLLDVWTLLIGESVLALRLFSVLCGLLALSATYAVGRRLFDRITGFMAVLVLGSASFFVYYTREARMYVLLLALAAFAAWLYLRWRDRLSGRRTLAYGLALALLLYTHYAGALIIAVHGIHLFLTARLHLRPRHGAPFLLAALLFAPWVPALLRQIDVNNGRPLADALPSDWGALAALWLIMTSGSWGQYALPFLFWRPVPGLRERWSDLLLLALWLLLTPAALLALNAWMTPVFQIRYNIAILPAGALIMAWALRHVRLPGRLCGPALSRPLTVLLLLWLVYTQLAMYTEFWPDKPRWNEAAAQLAASRQPLEPALFDLNPSSVAAYYARQWDLRRGITVDVAWRDHTPEEMRVIVDNLENAPAVWAVMRTDVPSTWDAVSSIIDTHGVGYRDSVMNVIFYRFDAASREPLRLRFGDALRYEGGIGHQLYTRAGERFCLPVALAFRALKPLGSEYTLEVYLTRGYNTLRAYWTAPLDSFASNEAFILEGRETAPCLDIPAGEPAGPHHLRMSLRHNGALLPLVEDADLYWGTALVFAAVSVG